MRSDAHFYSRTNGLGVYWLLCISCSGPSRINIMLPNLGFSVYEGESGGPIVSLHATLHIIPLRLSSYLLKFSTSWSPGGGTEPCLLYSFNPRALTSRHRHLPAALSYRRCWLSSGRGELSCVHRGSITDASFPTQR